MQFINTIFSKKKEIKSILKAQQSNNLNQVFKDRIPINMSHNPLKETNLTKIVV